LIASHFTCAGDFPLDHEFWHRTTPGLRGMG
jgi:hypothetical protein